jgi:predicted nucleic acid-binding protein
MITAIDTNILLDILTPNAFHFTSSKALIDEAYMQGALIINEVVYAELAVRSPLMYHLKSFCKELASD